MKAAFVALMVAGVAWVPIASGQDSFGLRSIGALGRAKVDERIGVYERLLGGAPEDLRLQGGLIAAYLQKVRETGDRAYLDRASTLVDRMLQTDGGDFSALRFENEIDLQRHEFQAVAERAEDMVKYAPSDAGTWGNLGDASMELGDYEQAGRAYRRMFMLRPDLGSYNRLAYFRFVTGDAAQGIALMKEAVAAGDPQAENTAWCWAELGDMYLKTGRVGEAAEAYQSALELFPALHRASAGLGKVEAARGDTLAAIRNYERAQSIVPLVEYAGALEDLYTRAGMAAKAKQQRELIEVVEKLGLANGERTNRNLALVLADRGRDLEVAVRLMETEIPTRGDVYTWDAFAWVLFKSGRLADAKAASAKALKLGTPEPMFYRHAKQIASAQ
ncbi:MAG: tetratricopeptide repeat protein [Acidobacteriaceae bacterium]|nr:tetratricopeptide repeat protein [Acidobacteriaceae bacterium]